MAGVPIGATRNGNTLYLHLFGVPEAVSLEVRLPEGVGEVRAVSQLQGAVTDWSAEAGTLHITVPAWADTAVQILKVEGKG